MRYLILALCIATSCSAQDADGICQITKYADDGTTTQWCGVAISKDRVLSCGHHRSTGDVRIEFCLGEYGSPYRVVVPGKILRADTKRDLSILSYEAPPWMRLRTYVVGRPKGQPSIRGFLRGSCEVRQGLPGREGLKVDGFIVREILTDCQQGLSGSPLVSGYTVGGILIGSGDGVSHCVSPETILEWLEE